VTHFIITLQGSDTGRVECAVVSQTLALLEHLVHLQVYAWGFELHLWPAELKAAFHDALLRPTFRSLDLGGFALADALELDALLGHASGLKALQLNGLAFTDSHAWRLATPPRDALRIFLDALEVTSASDTHSTLSALPTLDITRLRTLAILGKPLIPFLKASARTLQNMRYFFPERAYTSIFSLFASSSRTPGMRWRAASACSAISAI
jgi:hypothetical protein